MRRTHWTVPTRSSKRLTGVHLDLSALRGRVRFVEERAETAGRRRAKMMIRGECDSRAVPSGWVFILTSCFSRGGGGERAVPVISGDGFFLCRNFEFV